LDQDAIPTLIEVKRSSDTRIRREVVGQILDYAANAVVYWPVETIRARFEEACRKRETDAAMEVGTFVGPDTGVEEFWQRVKTNLQAERIRMVFVADFIPPELRRIVEFLNGQMDPAEILAVEIKQFVGQGLRTLVPRLVGQTLKAEESKGGPRPPEKQWDETSFFEELRQRRGESEAEVARKILAWGTANALQICWGKGSKVGSFYATLNHEEKKHYTTVVWTYGSIEIPFRTMLTRKPFDDQARRLELRDRLNAIPGVEIPADGINRNPSIPLAALGDDAAMAQFLAVLDWYVSEIRTV
jgi:hypothetical protein